MKKLLILTWGESTKIGYQGLRLAEEARKLGIEGINKSFTKLQMTLLKNKFEIFIDGEPLSNYHYLIYRNNNTHLGKQLNAYCKEYNIKFLNGNSYEESPFDLDKLKQYFIFSTQEIPFPETYFNIRPTEHASTIAKPIHGSFGMGIKLTQDLADEELESYIIQRRLNSKSDYRVIVLGEKVIGVMKRTAKEKMIVTNVAAGGDFEASSLPTEVLNVAIKAAKALNLEYSGVDVMLDNDSTPYILEANRNAYFEGFEKSTKINLAEEIVKYLVTQ